MPYIQVDVLLKTALEGALADLRANTYLLDDVFGGLVNDQLSAPDYGYKEVQEAKSWFLNNNVPVLMQNRTDLPTAPSFVIVSHGSREMQERAAIADDIEPLDEDFAPNLIQATPQYVYKPFTPKSYDPSTGTVTFPDGILTSIMAPGLFLVSKRGHAYVISKVLNATQFQIKANVTDDFGGAYVLPPYAVWNLKRERTFLEHKYSIFCTAQSSPVYALWLNALMNYILLRYKEVYLEGRGLELSTFGSGPLTLDSRFEAEKVYFIEVQLSGQTEMSVIKYVAPKLYEVSGKIKIIDGPTTPSLYQAQAKAQAWDMEGDKE